MMDEQRSSDDVLLDDWATEWLEYREHRDERDRERLEDHGGGKPVWTPTGYCVRCGADRYATHNHQCEKAA